MLLTLAAPPVCAGTTQPHALYSRLGAGPEKWVQLPPDPTAWNDGLPVYQSYDSGSVGKKNGVAYVRAQYGDKFGSPAEVVMAAHCKKKRMATLAIGKDTSGGSVFAALWNNGRVRFSNPGDGGDYTIWAIPSDSVGANQLFAELCQKKPPTPYR